MMMKATSAARARERCTAVSNALCVARAKRSASRSSPVKLCTTGTALSTSAAMALESATRSWLARESFRTRRPIHIAGSTTTTSIRSTMAMMRGLVQTSMTMAPLPTTALRRPIDSDEPTTVCTSVVSVVSRESTSPLCVVSKNSGL